MLTFIVGATEIARRHLIVWIAAVQRCDSAGTVLMKRTLTRREMHIEERAYAPQRAKVQESCKVITEA